jgi:7-cyano-7-deazaguanine synthase
MSVAIVLLSGGIDSATALAVALQEKRQVTALSIDYGQRHRVELDCARRLAARYDVPHKVAVIDLHAVGGSALTSGDMALERNRTLGDMTNVPRSYVPGRNTVFLSLALAWSEVLGASQIIVGANAFDLAGFPDCRPSYLAAFERVANLARPHRFGSLQVRAPLIRMSKTQVVRLGIELGVDYGSTSSCYDPAANGACASCDACVIRLAAFAELGLPDPIVYREPPNV